MGMFKWRLFFVGAGRCVEGAQPRWGWIWWGAMTQGSPETGNPGLGCVIPLGLFDGAVWLRVAASLWGATGVTRSGLRILPNWVNFADFVKIFTKCACPMAIEFP